MKRSNLLICALIVVFSSCNDNEVFKKEMYKNVVALISSDYYNSFQETVPLQSTGDGYVGYIAASSGGAHAPTKDLVIGLEEDATPLDLYNRSLYDIDDKLYARFLSRDKYEIENYEIRIKSGERTGKTMIKIHPDGLSPDSTYFIGLKATDVSGVEINPKKNTILYQILIKNDYATQADNVYYSMSGLVNGMVTAGNKKLFPLTYNRVRMVAGTETFESTIAKINKTAVILEVDDQHHVIIKPYKDIDVQQVDGDLKYPNTFKVEESFGHVYNVFLLSYEYTINGVKKSMQEELRLEVGVK